VTPLFTVHAGEYLVGTKLESEFRGCRVWLPTKDTGVDLLLTSASCSKSVPLQVKYSRDYVESFPADPELRSIARSSFFRVDRGRIERSPAQYWIIVLHSFTSRQPRFVVVPPSDLLRLIQQHHGRRDAYSLYFCVIGDRKCWELRGLSRREIKAALDAGAITSSRDFSRFLDDWSTIHGEIDAY